MDRKKEGERERERKFTFFPFSEDFNSFQLFLFFYIALSALNREVLCFCCFTF